MLNPNSKANTVISQSFIASQFQGYSDPFVNTKPTSSLNQFVRSKQTSDSGFIQDGQNKPFGFDNITTNHEPTQLQSFSRRAHESVQLNANQIPVERAQSNASNQAFNQSSNFNQQAVNKVPVQQITQQIPQQVPLNERYISPGIMKTDSPTKLNQFVNQKQNTVAQQPQNVNQYNNTQFINQNQSTLRGNQQSGVLTNQNTISQLSNQQSQFSTQQSQSRIQSNTNISKSSNNLQGSQVSSVGKRLKLNVSQQFSNSFTLNCVTEPQRSNILEMKKRQRQYRKSIQNFFV